MSRNSNIKWRKADKEKLAKEVRKFNAKRTRLINQYPYLDEYLPEKLSVKDIAETTKTRADYNKMINSIERFMKKESETPMITAQGIKTTKYEVREMQIKVNTINRLRQNERIKANVSTEKGTMGTIRANNLQPKKFDIQKMSKTEWDKFKESVEKQFKTSYYNDKPELYKANFLKAISNVFGAKGQNLIDKIKAIDAEKLIEMFYNDPVLQIDFIYDPIELQARLEGLEEHLDKYEDYMEELEE